MKIDGLLEVRIMNGVVLISIFREFLKVLRDCWSFGDFRGDIRVLEVLEEMLEF